MKNLLLFLSVLIIIPTLLPLFDSGFFTIHDNTQVERVFQMTKALSDGHFPVRWVEDLGYGYGYPIFNFYAPLPYYLGAFINIVLLNSMVSTKIMFGAGILLSFITMYFFASKLTNRIGGLAAGVIYLYFPYHAVNIYIRGAVGEFYAYAFLPLVFLGIYEIFEKLNKSNFRSVVRTAFFFSIPIFLVIISHNLSAFMMGLMLIPYTVFLIFNSKKKKEFFYLLMIMFSLSFLLSSFYLLPAVFESSYTNVSSQIGGGADYRDHFVCVTQLWHSDWGFGGSVNGCVDGLSFSLGKFNIIILISALALFLFKFSKRKNNLEMIFWFLLIFSLFLLLPYSKFVWDYVPFMEYLQYPWRMLNFTGLYISIIAAFLIYKIENKRLMSLITVLIVLGQLYFNYNLFVPVDKTNIKANEYENLVHIKTQTSKISDEYMPPDFSKPESFENVPNKLVENVDYEILDEKVSYVKFKVSGNGEKLLINKAFFPSWKAYVNGKEVKISSEKKGMSIHLPKGVNAVELRFKPTLIQSIGNFLSLIGIMLLLVVIITRAKK